MKETKFKQTEVGMIPSDWEVKKIGDEFTIVTGSTPPTNNSKNYGDDYLFVSPMDLGSNKWILKTEKKLSIKGFSISRPYPANSILFTCIGSTIGKCGIASCIMTSNQQINAVFPNEDYSSEFVYYVLLEKGDAIRSQAGCQAVPLINKSEFAETLIQVPPTIEEQQRIANALSDVDTLIANLEKLIAKKKNIKQGAMQQLLTGKKRLPGFASDERRKECHSERSAKREVEESSGYKMTELGLIPSDWEVKTVSDVADNFIGLTYSPENVRDYGTLVLRSSNIQNDKIVYEDNVFVDMVIPERALAHDGDILVCVRNGSKALIGKSAILDIGNTRMAFGAFMTVLRAKRGINNRYLLYAWQSNMIQDQVQESLGATINQITNADFKRFYLLTPSSIEEQTAIANVLSDMDTEISALETKLAKYRALKTGMMQQLLTGKIRLV